MTTSKLLQPLTGKAPLAAAAASMDKNHARIERSTFGCSPVGTDKYGHNLCTYAAEQKRGANGASRPLKRTSTMIDSRSNSTTVGSESAVIGLGFGVETTKMHAVMKKIRPKNRQRCHLWGD